MMIRNRRAKIVATVGPASASPEMLKALFLAGVDTFRLNFSHGTHDAHRAVFRAIRALEAEMGQPIGILQDLQGPKIRIGQVAAGPLKVAAGDAVTFVQDTAPGTLQALPLPHPEIFAAIKVGHHLLIDDGRVRLEVMAHDPARIETRVLVGGTISDRKGVNLPDTVLDLPVLTPKDRADLALGLELGVDWVALSFVQTPDDLRETRALIGGAAGLVAKIEKPSALRHLAEIVDLADAVMVARGDLGVEIPPEDVPGRQKEIVRLCREWNKPVIVATQMLESMISAPTPTRAEASDVAAAIYDGADAVMLSAESATGAYPCETVTIMDRIICRTEGHAFYDIALGASDTGPRTVADAIAGSAASLAAAVNAPAIVAYSSTGATAACLAGRRPARPILVITEDVTVSRRLCLVWGSRSVLEDDVVDYDTMVELARRTTEGLVGAAPAHRIVIVCGIPFGTPGSTNNIRVARIAGSNGKAHFRNTVL